MKPEECRPGTAVRITVNGREGIIIGNIFTVKLEESDFPAVNIITTKGYITTWTIRWLEKITIRGGTL